MDSFSCKVRILLLAEKWQNGTITPEEKKEFEKWYNSFDDSILEVPLQDNMEVIKDRIFDTIVIRIYTVKSRKLLFSLSFLNSN